MSLYVNSIFSGAACMLFGSAAIAVANVIAEAMIVEKSRGESQARSLSLSLSLLLSLSLSRVCVWCV